jgi:hypothetical protein
LKVGSPTIISFSNRCFPSKAVAIWHQLDDRGHMRLVERYLKVAGNFANIRSLDRSPPAGWSVTRSTPSSRRALGPTLVD